MCAGRKKRDFSCGSGFYLTKSLDDALNWANSTTAKPAILVFQVDRQHLDDSRKLNLSDDEGKWREIVSSFRSAKRTAKTRKQLSSYDLIEGPMATVTRSETSEDLVFEPKPSSLPDVLDFRRLCRRVSENSLFDCLLRYLLEMTGQEIVLENNVLEQDLGLPCYATYIADPLSNQNK